MLAGQIAAAQQQLRDETDRLVGHPAERAAILQITLRAQLAVSRQLANLLAVAQTSPLIGTKLANIAEQLTQVHRSDPSTAGRQRWEGETERGEDDYPSTAEANARFPIPLTSFAPGEDEEAYRRPDDNVSYTLFSKIGAGLSAVAADTSSRSLALAGCLLCVLFVAYARLGASDQQELAIRSLPASEPKVAAVPRVRPPLVQTQNRVTQVAQATVILPEAEAVHEGDPDPPVTAPAPEPRPPYATAHALISKFSEQNVGPAPQDDNWGGTVTSARPLAASKPMSTISSYVPVVFTHQDKDTAESAFAELQLQYPKLLRNRRSGLKEVRVGEKGVWYRVFLLPPGTREQATETCARLAAAGHDRCWVKEYNSD